MSTFLCTILAGILNSFFLHAGFRVVSGETPPLSQLPLFPQLLLSLSGQKYAPDASERILGEYDYIIVGGGAAGSVVASRLSEEPCVSVLLLEAGPKPPLISEVPGLIEYYLVPDEVAWKFMTVPQKHLDFGLKNKQLLWLAGKMLGGSGSFNLMYYSRGNRKNYDGWAAQGAEGWSYKDVLPYFLKLEDNRNLPFLDIRYHATGGPITFEKPRIYSSAKTAILEAVEELGYEFVDTNGARQTGFSDFQMNLRNGQRCSTVKGYLVPAEHRPNLDILMNAMVTKVIIQHKNATGVEFFHNGRFQTVKARKEVIVSGGTVNTPKLLMLSGIGPREELQKWNIPLIVDLPVGKNLQENPASNYHFTIDPQFNTRKNLLDSMSIQEYIKYRSGPLATAGLVGSAFLNGLNTSPDIDFPNYHIILGEIKGTEQSSGLEPEIYRQYFGPIDENRTFYICSSSCIQPRSRGTVTLCSADPFDPPLFDPNYLEVSEDLDDIVDGLKLCKKIVHTKALRRLGAKPFETLLPGCEAYASSDDDYFKCFARRFLSTAHHSVGTSKMGDPRDPSTVVDPELRVKGVNGLRVVDASVMPIIPSGSIYIPTIMVAEKASDIIKKSIQCN